MKKIYVTSLGCKVNQYEVQALRNLFAEEGCQSVGSPEEADICVINTCSVTGVADRKSRQLIRHCRRANPETIIAVTGCYAQVGSRSLAAMPEADVVAGTNEKLSLPELVKAFEADREKKIRIKKYEELKDFEELGPAMAMEGRTRAYIKIQEGCNRFCSYCIIPYSRGPVRSRDRAAVLEEARMLIEGGCREIVLTGINTALYGADDGGESRIDELIAGLNSLPGDFRIRLSSLEPTVINGEFIKRLFPFEKLCHHVHLSCQSGSDNILKAMNRLYSREDYLDIVKVIREFDENYGITTDLIVGFPEETDGDFEESVRLCNEADFCRVHVFRYSKRSGTPAAAAKNQVPGTVSQSRAVRLSEAASESSERFLKNNLGTERSVLFEEYLKDKGLITGLTDNYIRIYVKWEDNELKPPLNEFRRVRLEDTVLDGILGILL